MRFLSSLVRVGAACASLLAIPSFAAGQPGFTLTGRLVEQFPGGGAIGGPSLIISRATTNTELPTFVGVLSTCVGGGPATCIDANGAFTMTDLVEGTYLLRFNAVGFVPKSQSVGVNSNTNVGNIQLIRKPFVVELGLSEIPAAGGSIPVTLRATTAWAAPTIPVVVRVEKSGETTHGFLARATPTTIDFIWPFGLSDTGVVPFTTLDVAPTDPAGGLHCVSVEIRLQSNLQIVLGSDSVCTQKRP